MASKPTREAKQRTATAQRSHTAADHERETPLAATAAAGPQGQRDDHMMISQNNLGKLQHTVGNRAVQRLLARRGAPAPLTIQRQITIGEETKSVGWLVVKHFNNTDSAFDILQVIDMAKETFASYDELIKRVSELTNLVKLYKYLINHTIPIVEKSKYAATGENGETTYSREYTFTGVTNLLIHVHWKKKGKHIDVAKAHFKSLKNKFVEGMSLNLTASELISIGLPTTDTERLQAF